MSNQLVKKNPTEVYQNVFPKTWIDAIKDKESGVSLQEILQGFNMYFLSYNGSRALTRCKVPSILRKEGLWITYVLYDHTVVTEWYNSDQIDDNSWSMDSNWRIASNNLVGDISVSSDGYWVINGEKTEAKAQGEQGVTPLLRVGANNKLQVSYNAGKAWKDISDYVVPRFKWNQGIGTTAGTIQISMDLGKTWTNLSNKITNNLRISRYIGINESLPTSGVAEGTIYMKGPYYNEGDTSNANPIYRMWVYAWKGDTLAWQDNGEFTAISARVVQERGNSTTEVMSQDAITRELTEVELETKGTVLNVGKESFTDNAWYELGRRIENSTTLKIRSTDKIEIPNRCKYIVVNAIGGYDEEIVFFDANIIAVQYYRLKDYSGLTLSIPENAKYIVTSNYFDVNDDPSVLFFDEKYELTTSVQICEKGANLMYLNKGYIRGHYYSTAGLLEDAGDNELSYLPKVDVSRYRRISFNCSTYSDAAIVEFDADDNVVAYHQPHYNSIESLKDSYDVALNALTIKVGITILVKKVTYSGNTYYPQPNLNIYVYGIRDEMSSDIKQKSITSDEFSVLRKYIEADGKESIDLGVNVNSTDFIDIPSWGHTLYIKSLSCPDEMFLAFYDENKSFVMSYDSNHINTSLDGLSKYCVVPHGARYVRMTNAFVPFKINGVTYPAIANPFVSVVGNNGMDSINHYGASYIGVEKCASFNFDYSNILFYGQSFSIGAFSKKITNEFADNAYMLGNSVFSVNGTLSNLNIPNDSPEYPVVSCVNALASMNKANKFIASVQGEGGRSISYFEKGGVMFNNVKTQASNIKNAVSALGKTVGCSAIVYMQGESDYNPSPLDYESYTNDKNTYKQKLLQLKNDLQQMAIKVYGQEKKPLFCIYQTSGKWITDDKHSGKDNADMPISMAQYELAMENDDVMLITPAYFMPSYKYQNDHPSSNGYRWFGEMAAKAIQERIIRGINFANTHPKRLYKSGNKVVIECIVPVLPLRIDLYTSEGIMDYGFQILDSAKSEIQIKDIKVFDNVVELHTNRNLESETISVSYGGRYRNGAGNICDSDTWQSLQQYVDDLNDRGNDNSCTIGYRPKDKDGNFIFGKNYPMQNYMSNFYFEL